MGYYLLLLRCIVKCPPISIKNNYRLHEFDEQVKAVRDGMSKVIPVPLLSLFSGYELETMVCGSPDIPLSLLKSVATYKGKSIAHVRISVSFSAVHRRCR